MTPGAMPEDERLARDEAMLEMLATGAQTRKIAKHFKLSDGTMRVYLHNLYRRLGVRNKTEAAAYYFLREIKHLKQQIAVLKKGQSK